VEEHELISQIEGFGLSNKESRVYLAALGLGGASVQTIADRAGIKRVTTYVILESLQGQGLVAQTVKAKKTFFVAEDPSHLQRLLERKADEVAGQIKEFRKILPRLEAVHSEPNDSPELNFYDGTDSVRGLFRDFFTTYFGKATEILLFCNLDELSEILPEPSINSASAERVARGITSRLIYTSERQRLSVADEKAQLRVSRFVPASKYPVTGDIGILGDCVILISLSQNRPVGVRIRNAEMARSMRALFEMAWDQAGRLP
jgi:sugar-specific transcriptional regulator TrmB